MQFFRWLTVVLGQVVLGQEICYPSESDEGKDGLMVLSAPRLKLIEDHLNTHPISLLRSPPYSGKTTLGQALRDRFLLQPDCESVYISMASIHGRQELHDEKLFQRFWREKVGFSWDELINFRRPTYIFIDEAQIIYGGQVPFFWGTLKALLSNPGKNEFLRILIFAAYDPTLSHLTPIRFQHSLGSDALRLRRDEFDQLVASFIKLKHSLGSEVFTIPGTVSNAIYNLTGGHVGLCRTILSTLRCRFRDGGSTADMLRYLISPDFRALLLSTRSFAWTQYWCPTPAESDFLRRVFLSCDSESVCHVDPDLDEDMVRRFIKSGLLARNNSGLQFAAPIMRVMLGQRLFTARVSDPYSSTTFDEFLIRAIERMSTYALKRSLGRGAIRNRLLERTWQMEWYRAATSACPIEATISPDVGPVFGSVGFLDFYVNGDLCWGVELLREGDRMKQHAARFTQEGQYNAIPLKKWVIIDFRHYSKDIKELHPNFWYVIYSDDYKEVVIKRLNRTDKTIVLRGHNNSLDESALTVIEDDMDDEADSENSLEVEVEKGN